MGGVYINNKIIIERKEKEQVQTDLIDSKLAVAELVEQMETERVNYQLALAEVIEIIEGGTTA